MATDDDVAAARLNGVNVYFASFFYLYGEGWEATFHTKYI